MFRVDDLLFVCHARLLPCGDVCRNTHPSSQFYFLALLHTAQQEIPWLPTVVFGKKGSTKSHSADDASPSGKDGVHKIEGSGAALITATRNEVPTQRVIIGGRDDLDNPDSARLGNVITSPTRLDEIRQENMLQQAWIGVTSNEVSGIPQTASNNKSFGVPFQESGIGVQIVNMTSLAKDEMNPGGGSFTGANVSRTLKSREGEEGIITDKKELSHDQRIEKTEGGMQTVRVSSALAPTQPDNDFADIHQTSSNDKSFELLLQESGIGIQNISVTSLTLDSIYPGDVSFTDASVSTLRNENREEGTNTNGNEFSHDQRVENTEGAVQTFHISSAQASNQTHDGVASTGEDPQFITIVHSKSGAIAKIHLVGATVTSFQPSSGRELLFALHANGAIRGGIPIVFPRIGRPNQSMPRHGILGTKMWTAGTPYDDEDEAGCNFTFGPTDTMDFTATITIKVGPSSLTTKLTIMNNSKAPFEKVQALFHTYHSAIDPESRCAIGLGGYTVTDMVRGRRFIMHDDSLIIDGNIYQVFSPPKSHTNMLDIAVGSGGSGTRLQAYGIIAGTKVPVGAIVWNPSNNDEEKPFSKNLTDMTNEEEDDVFCVMPGILEDVTINSGQKMEFTQILGEL